MKMKKMNYQKAYLEEFKYKIKKIKMSKFINTKLESESESQSESELESDTELESKSKSKYDSEQQLFTHNNVIYYLLLRF